MLPAYLPERAYPDSIPKPGSAARRLERPAGHFFVSDSPNCVVETGTPADNRYARSGNHANRSGAKMIKYVQCLRRHPDLSPADFRRHWEEYKALWAEVAQQLAAIRVSFSTTLAIDANDRIAIERGTAEPFDGLVETWTHDAHDLETRRGEPAAQELQRRLFAKQHEFLDLPQCSFFFTADDD